MPSAARLNLESILRNRRLDRTLTTALPARQPGDPDLVVSTGIAALDEQLGGGVPRGQISEIAGPRSSGRTSLLFATLASATARGELVALVDTCDTLDPQSAATAGIDLGRLLWVRGEPVSAGAAIARSRSGGRTGGDERSPTDRLLERAVKALNLILQAGGFDIVALDLVDVPVPSIRRLPFPTWLRLHRVFEGSRTACLLVAGEPVARSAGGVTIALGTGRFRGRGDDGPVVNEWSGPKTPALSERSESKGIWAGDAPHPRLFRGLRTEARLISARLHGDDAPCEIGFTV